MKRILMLTASVFLLSLMVASAVVPASAEITKITDQWCFDVTADSYYTATAPIIDGKFGATEWADPTIEFSPDIVLPKGLTDYSALAKGTSQTLYVSWDGDYLYFCDYRVDKYLDLRGALDCWKTDGGIIALQVSDPSYVEEKQGEVLQFYYTPSDSAAAANGNIKVRQLFPGIPQNTYMDAKYWTDYVEIAVGTNETGWFVEGRIAWDFVFQNTTEYDLGGGKQIEFNYCFWDYSNDDGIIKQCGYARWCHQYAELGLLGHDYGGWGVLNLLDLNQAFKPVHVVLISDTPTTEVTTADPDPVSTVDITTSAPGGTSAPPTGPTGTTSPESTTTSQTAGSGCGSTIIIGYFIPLIFGAALLNKKRI